MEGDCSLLRIILIVSAVISLFIPFAFFTVTISDSSFGLNSSKYYFCM